MIKTINAVSEWIRVEGRRPYMMPPRVKFEYPKNPHDGQIIYNFELQEVQIYVDDHWINIQGHAMIGIHEQTEKVLQWAKQKMEEEKALLELCEKYPALAEAREQFEAMKVLVNKNE